MGKGNYDATAALALGAKITMEGQGGGGGRAMKLHDFEVCRKGAEQMMNDGHVIHQQFNCAHCGVKQTMGEPNQWYATGRCEECGKVTDIAKDGCNYMVVLSL